VGPQDRQCPLDERERGDDVDAIHVLERGERVVGQRRLWRRPEHAGVVDQQGEVAELGGPGHEGVSVEAAGDVPCHAHDGRAIRELGHDLVEGDCAPGVEHEGPAPLGERPGGGPAESPRSSGDDGDWHVGSSRRRPQ
jgi:hypothetical protein